VKNERELCLLATMAPHRGHIYSVPGFIAPRYELHYFTITISQRQLNSSKWNEQLSFAKHKYFKRVFQTIIAFLIFHIIRSDIFKFQPHETLILIHILFQFLYLEGKNKPF